MREAYRNPHGIAVIDFTENGKDKTVSVGAHADKDNEETIRAWLKRWHPTATLKSFRIRRMP